MSLKTYSNDVLVMMCLQPNEAGGGPIVNDESEQNHVLDASFVLFQRLIS
jgi:hypothetical protein